MSSSPVSQRHPLSRALHGAILGLIVSSYALPSLAQPVPADHNSPLQQWNIPGGPLAPALDRFARQAGPQGEAQDLQALAPSLTAASPWLVSGSIKSSGSVMAQQVTSLC